jgi:hypothetical protein
VAEIEHALADMRWHWDGAYRFSHDGVRYWACRADNGAVISHPDLAAFRDLLRRDYICQPVPRDLPNDRSHVRDRRPSKQRHVGGNQQLGRQQ